VPGHAYVRKPTSAVFNHHEDIQQSERGGDGNEEIARHHRQRVILQERRPALITSRLTSWPLRHVLADRARRDPDAQLDQQFIGDPLFASQRVLGGHSANQASQFRWNRRSTPFARESPKQTPTGTVPADDRFRTHNDDCVVPIEQTGKKRQADPCYGINAPRLDPSLDVMGELLSED